MVQLKARINAYGLYSEMDYSKDTHIWNLIAEMEKQEAARNKNEYYWEESDGKQEEYNKNKDLLLKFLSLLLKSDWDRSKYEIEGNKQLLLSNFLNIATVILSMLMFNITFNLDLAISKEFRVFFALIVSVIWLGEAKYGPAILRKVLTIVQRKSSEEIIISSNGITNFVSKLIKPVCLFIPVIVIFGVNKSRTLIIGNFDITYLFFILIVIFLVPSSWACYNYEIESFHRRQNYFFTID